MTRPVGHRPRGRHVRQSSLELAVQVCRTWLAGRRGAWRQRRARTEVAR